MNTGSAWTAAPRYTSSSYVHLPRAQHPQHYNPHTRTYGNNHTTTTPKTQHCNTTNKLHATLLTQHKHQQQPRTICIISDQPRDKIWTKRCKLGTPQPHSSPWSSSRLLLWLLWRVRAGESGVDSWEAEKSTPHPRYFVYIRHRKRTWCGFIFGWLYYYY